MSILPLSIEAKVPRDNAYTHKDLPISARLHVQPINFQLSLGNIFVIDRPTRPAQPYKLYCVTFVDEPSVFAFKKYTYLRDF